jgi:hypothetical protein
MADPECGGDVPRTEPERHERQRRRIPWGQADHDVAQATDQLHDLGQIRRAGLRRGLLGDGVEAGVWPYAAQDVRPDVARDTGQPLAEPQRILQAVESRQRPGEHLLDGVRYRLGVMQAVTHDVFDQPHMALVQRPERSRVSPANGFDLRGRAVSVAGRRHIDRRHPACAAFHVSCSSR